MDINQKLAQHIFKNVLSKNLLKIFCARVLVIIIPVINRFRKSIFGDGASEEGIIGATFNVPVKYEPWEEDSSKMVPYLIRLN